MKTEKFGAISIGVKLEFHPTDQKNTATLHVITICIVNQKLHGNCIYPKG